MRAVAAIFLIGVLSQCVTPTTENTVTVQCVVFQIPGGEQQVRCDWDTVSDAATDGGAE